MGRFILLHECCQPRLGSCRRQSTHLSFGTVVEASHCPPGKRHQQQCPAPPPSVLGCGRAHWRWRRANQFLAGCINCWRDKPHELCRMLSALVSTQRSSCQVSPVVVQLHPVVRHGMVGHEPVLTQQQQQQQQQEQEQQQQQQQ